MTLTDIGTVILAFATTISLIYISRQVSVTRRQTKGQFLLALDDQFEKTNDITRRLIGDQQFKPVGDQWIELWRLMSVFERINIMVEDKILDVAIVDRLHGFRLMYLIANDSIFERLLVSGSEWQDFIDLCHAIADHRKHDGMTQNERDFVERVSKLNKKTNGLNNPFQV